MLIRQGYGDDVKLRIDATDSYRRRADCELIVSTSNRPLNDRDVKVLLKRSIRTHGARRTILVLTKIDVSVGQTLVLVLVLITPPGALAAGGRNR